VRSVGNARHKDVRANCQAQTNPAYTKIGVGFYHDETCWWEVREFGNG
jgi:hypothetical protein